MSFPYIALLLLSSGITDISAAVCGSSTVVGLSDTTTATTEDNDSTEPGFSSSDDWIQLMYDTKYQVACTCGTIYQWELYIDNDYDTVNFQVWREQSGTFTLIGQNSLTTSSGMGSGTTYPYNVPMGDQIAVKKGDYIGFSVTGKRIIRYTSGGSYKKTQTTGTVNVLGTFDWTSVTTQSGRDYGFNAKLTSCNTYDYVENRVKNFDDALADCESKGMTLASMKTESEYDDMKAYIISVAGNSPDNDVWFGLREDTSITSSYVYKFTDDNTVQTWTKWNPDEPNYQDAEKCIRLSVSAWTMKTRECHRTFDYVCKAQDPGPQFSNLDYSTTVADTVAVSTEIVTVTVTDDAADIPNLATNMTSSSSNFAFDTTTLKLTVSSAVSSGSYNLGFKVEDECERNSTGNVAITVTNSIPVISSLPATISVKETVSTLTLVHNFSVADSSPSDSVTCSLKSSAPATSDFVVQQTGSATSFGVYVNDGALLDQSANPTHTLTIECTDTKDPVNSTLSVTILANQAPTVSSYQSDVSLSALTTGSGVSVLQINASDPDSSFLNYTMTVSPSGGPFEITSTGEVVTTSSLASLTVPSYNLSIYVTDESHTIGPMIITITITDITTTTEATTTTTTTTEATTSTTEATTTTTEATTTTTTEATTTSTTEATTTTTEATTTTTTEATTTTTEATTTTTTEATTTTTTEATTTTVVVEVEADTLEYKTFFMDNRNVAWFTSICLTALVCFTLIALACHHYDLLGTLGNIFKDPGICEENSSSSGNSKSELTKYRRDDESQSSQTKSWVRRHFRKNNVNTQPNQFGSQNASSINHDSYARIFRK